MWRRNFLKNDGPIKTKQGSEQAVAVKARDVLLDVMQEQPDSEANGARADSRQLRSQLLQQVDMQAILRVLNILCDESVCLQSKPFKLDGFTSEYSLNCEYCTVCIPATDNTHVARRDSSSRTNCGLSCSRFRRQIRTS